MSYSKEEVVKLCKEVNGDKYDYSITEGVKNKLGKIKYVCPTHGIIEQCLHNHLQGKGCGECGNLRLKLMKTPSKEEFIKKASKKHNIDDYDWTNFSPLKRDSGGRVELCCKKHGKYWYSPAAFISGYGCPICYGKSKDDEEVRQELSKLHPELDFSNTKYSEKDKLYRIKVMCPKHGEQLINYYNLKNGQGCFYCGVDKRAYKNTITNEEFIRRGVELFGDKYSYDKLDSYNRDENGKVVITCKEHGDFKAFPSNFFKGVGCPSCQESSIENMFRIFLERNEIKYEYQKRFDWLGMQSIDFYLPDYNVGVECQGLQHFMEVTIFGGVEQLKKTQERDNRKKELCEEHELKLLYYSNIKNLKYPYKVITSESKMLKEIKGV